MRVLFAFTLPCLIGCGEIIGLEERVPFVGSPGAALPDDCDATPAGDYESEVLSDEPVLFWHFDDPVGSATVAASVGGDGIVTNADLGAAGAFVGAGTSVSLAGNATVHIDDTGLGFAGDEPWSLELWLYVDGTGEDDPRVVFGKFADCCASPGQHGYQLRFEVGPTPTFQFIRAIAEEIPWTGAARTPPPEPFRWHHVVTTYEPGPAPQQRLYVDGQLAGVGNELVGTAANDAVFVVGGFVPGESALIGRIDELSAYDRTLSCRHVTRHYRAALP